MTTDNASISWHGGAQARPGNSGPWVALGFALFAALWLVHLSSTSLSPPTDNIEQLTWAGSVEWGYYKHPPLPTWILWVLVQVFGAKVWLTYALATAMNMASLGLLWRFLRALRGERFATLSLAATGCVSYYNVRLDCYNHNTVLMLVATVSMVLCWKAVVTQGLRWWMALGLTLGLGLLTKYQVAITIVSIVAFWATQRGWRSERNRIGLLLAALIALLVFAPHVYWLRTHDFGPVGYALDSSLGADLGLFQRMLDVLNWLADQLLNRALAAWLFLLLAVFLARPTRRPSPGEQSASARHSSTSRALLMCWGLVPLLFMPAVGLVAGSRLHLPWGTPYLLFAIPAAMEILDAHVAWSRIPWRVMLFTTLSTQWLLLSLSMLTSSFGPAALRDQHWRSFDSRTLARQMAPMLVKAEHGESICAVSGPTALAGVLAMRLPGHPQVLIDGRYDRSPWVHVERVKSCALLEVQQGASMPAGMPAGPLFPGIWWRVTPSAHAASVMNR